MFVYVKNILIFLLVLIIISGCQSFCPHPWTTTIKVKYGNWFEVFDNPNIEYISLENLSRVKDADQADAIRRLESDQYLRLSKEEYIQLSQNPKQLKGNEIPFLVRGVSWSKPPLFSLVTLDRSNGTLYAIQYTYNGEIYIPGKYESIPNPIIAVLDVQVSQVIPDAVWGGDWIMGRAGWSSDKAWKEDFQQK